MKKTILLIMVALMVMSVPALSARLANGPVTHPPITIYQAYCGATCEGVGNQVFQGLNGFGADVIEAVPGILAINPGGTQPLDGWPNFVSASQVPFGATLYSGAAIPGSPKTAIAPGPFALPWTVTNVSMRKTVPTYICTVAIGGAGVLQQGSANIRLWWPLMYELPGTTWTLTISYKTTLWNDGGFGPTGLPNLDSTTHQNVWTWTVGVTLDSMERLVDLFHELPVGSCQVPLINGRDLYESLEAALDNLETYEDASGVIVPTPQMAEDFTTFILLLEDSCLTVDCGTCSSDLGIRNTSENPACCKLLADADFLFAQLGVGVPSK
jgi:hypothetical protein